MPFTEANPGGGAAASSSIYAVAFGEGQLVGIQNCDVDVRDLGELETKPVERTRSRVVCGTCAISKVKQLQDLRGIKDAALVA